MTTPLWVTAILGLLAAISVVLHLSKSKTLNAFADRIDALETQIGFRPAATSPAIPSALAAGVKALLLFLVIGLCGLTSTGCSTVKADVKAAPAAAVTAIVVCAKQDAPAIAKVALELGSDAVASLLQIGAVSWGTLVSDSLAAGREVGGCAYAQFVAALEKATTTPAPASSTVARAEVAPQPAPTVDLSGAAAGLAQLRAHLGGGVKWQLADGTVR